MARLHQLILALVFLTRLPLGRWLPPRVLPLADAAWAFPLAGVAVAALAVAPMALAGPGLLPAALTLALICWLTGALHEDALADFADAGGGRTPEDRLRIMRDSTIGSFGAAALVAALAIRLTALAAVGPWALIGAAAFGRAVPVAVMRGLPPARGDGLGHGAGRPSFRAVAAALVIGAAALILTAPGPVAGLAGLVAGALAGLAVALRARRLLGGQTGDVLGAAILSAETAALVGMALLT